MRALFLDRDGVINEDFGYVARREEFVFRDGVFEALRGFCELGFEIFVVTNQSGIGRGYYTLEDFLRLNEFMLAELLANGVRVKKVFFCPHAPEVACECRKPRPGMLLSAAAEFGLTLKEAVMVGDKMSDMEAGKNAGVGACFLVGSDAGKFGGLREVLEAVKSGIK